MKSARAYHALDLHGRRSGVIFLDLGVSMTHLAPELQNMYGVALGEESYIREGGPEHVQQIPDEEQIPPQQEQPMIYNEELQLQQQQQEADDGLLPLQPLDGQDDIMHAAEYDGFGSKDQVSSGATARSHAHKPAGSSDDYISTYDEVRLSRSYDNKSARKYSVTCNL